MFQAFFRLLASYFCFVRRLGKFDLEEHKTWLKNNPTKKPNIKGNTVSHFYSSGSYCDKANILRETEVDISSTKKRNTTDAMTTTLFLGQICMHRQDKRFSFFDRIVPQGTANV